MPLSSALAGGFLTTGLPGMPQTCFETKGNLLAHETGKSTHGRGFFPQWLSDVLGPDFSLFSFLGSFWPCLHPGGGSQMTYHCNISKTWKSVSPNKQKSWNYLMGQTSIVVVESLGRV